jgi:mannan endo-1,4-beta-mannosidase
MHPLTKFIMESTRIAHLISKSVIILILFALGCAIPGKDTTQVISSGFVEVDGSRFVLEGETYRFAGTNFWYGAYLGSPGPEGDRERLIRELDLLSNHGINNLRILAASEQANHTRALQPSFQSAPGVVNDNLLIGLDFLLAEMAKRDMKAVIFLNNMWEWSGGMSVYSEWFGEGPATDPGDTGDWHGFQNHAARFYFNEEAQQAWRGYISTVILRSNSITGTIYNEDPTIMSWQLANEPRPGSGDEGIQNADQFIKWIHESASYIKSLAPNQLVSTGNEGLAGSRNSERIYLDAHRSPDVDYLTFHMWAKNWGWFDATNMEASYSITQDSARAYIQKHINYAAQLNKPTVLSEFGLGRDFERFDLESPVTYRDNYLDFVFRILEESMEKESAVAGSNFWSWGGYGMPQHEDARWRPGDPFVGDPPQEPQGLNSVFASDTTTLNLIHEHAKRLRAITSSP